MMYNKIEFFKSYFTRASEKQLLVESLNSRMTTFTEKLNLLDLGCHDGALLQRIVERYHDRFPRQVKFTAVDPSPNAIDELVQRDFTQHYSVTPYVGTAESYFSKHATHFDWIIASQSLYWSDDLAAIIQQISNASDSALIVLRGKKGIHQIQSKFKTFLGNKDEQLYTADDIEKALIAQNILYEKEAHTTSITLPNSDDLALTWLIGFFLQNDHIENDESMITHIKNYITEIANNGILEHDVVFFWLGNGMHKLI